MKINALRTLHFLHFIQFIDMDYVANVIYIYKKYMIGVKGFHSTLVLFSGSLLTPKRSLIISPAESHLSAMHAVFAEIVANGKSEVIIMYPS